MPNQTRIKTKIRTRKSIKNKSGLGAIKSSLARKSKWRFGLLVKSRKD